MQLLEPLPILEGIHRHPESVVGIRGEAPGGNQALERFLNKLFSRFEVIEDLGPERKVTAVDPNAGPADVLQPCDATVVGQGDEVIAQIRLDAYERRDRAALTEMRQLRWQRQVGQAVAVVRQELPFIREMLLDRFQTLADIRTDAGVDKRDASSRWMSRFISSSLLPPSERMKSFEMHSL